MAEQRAKALTVLLQYPSKRGASKLELFAAEQWQGGEAGMYRVRLDGKWLCMNGGKYSFFTLDALAQLLGREVGKALGLSQSASGRPNLPDGSVVRVPSRVLAGQQFYDVTRTSGEPIQGVDGRWHVMVHVYGRGAFHAPVDTLLVKELGRPLKRRGR